MMKKSILGIFCLSISILAAVSSAWAAEPKLLGTFKDWAAYEYKEGAGKVCFMMTKPKKSEGKYKKRGDVYVQVTFRTADKTKDVVSFAQGYPLKSGQDVIVKVDSETFKLFPDGEMAWAHDDAGDKALTAALRKGKSAVVKGISNRGTNTTDTYSLKGSSAAYQAISKACKF